MLHLFEGCGYDLDYHLYEELWEADVGNVLICEQESDSTSDKCCRLKKVTIVGHLPCKFARVCLLFLQQLRVVHVHVGVHCIQ